MRFYYSAAAAAATSPFVSAFTSYPFAVSSSQRINVLSCLGKNEESSLAQKKLEQVMETSSSAGAKAIAKMDLQERTKRAMLAEAVEDRIFELAEELELLIKQNDGCGSFSEFPDDVREEALEIAKQTKALQVQYDDLVNGRPSLLLDLEGAFANDSLSHPPRFGDNHK